MAIANEAITGDAAKADKKVDVQTPLQKDASAATAKAEVVDPNLEKRSADLAIVGTLGDPSDIDRLVINDNKVEKPRIVGYTVKNVSQTPIDIMEFGLTEKFSKNHRLDHGEKGVAKTLAPGQSIDLTLFETAYLAALPEINGLFAGGENPVRAALRQGNTNSSSEMASDQAIQLTVSPAQNGKFKMQDLPQKEILTVDFETRGGKRIPKNRQMKPGFEKFAPIAENKKRKATVSNGRTASTPQKKRLALADVLLQSVAANSSKTQRAAKK